VICRHTSPRIVRPASLFSTSCVCLLVALLLTGCSSSNTGIPNPTATRAAGSPLSTPTAPAISTSIPQTTSTVITNLAPVKTPLAPPPQDCAIKPPPRQQHVDALGPNSNVQLVGGGAFWFYGGFYTDVLHLDSNQGWPMTKWVVEVGPNYSLPITLRLQNIQTRQLAWWTDAQTPPGAATQTLILNPDTDITDVGSVPGIPDVPHGPSGPYSEWGLFPVFFTAGCYSLEASWAGGSWQSVIAVGS
jgi:hypothetical protein